MNTNTSSLVNVLRYLERPLMSDGRIDLGETALCMRMIRPFVQAGEPSAVELNQLLCDVRQDGRITPEESERLIRMLAKLANENQELSGYVKCTQVNGVKTVDTSAMHESVGAFKVAIKQVADDLVNTDFSIVGAPFVEGRIWSSAIATHMGKALVTRDDAMLKGDKILLVDDVLTDGVKLVEAIKRIEASGGKIVKVVVVAEVEGFGARINALKGYPVFSLVKVTLK